MSKLLGITTAVPSHLLTQSAAKVFAQQAFKELFANENSERLLGVFDHSEVDTRHLAVPIEWLAEKRNFFAANQHYITAAAELGVQVVNQLLAQTQTNAEQIDQIVFVSTTGIATPSIDAYIANKIPFRKNVRRVPLWGLGCLGGAAGLAHAADLARAYPQSRVLFIALELCSLTFQSSDVTKKNLVATSLFGDGAAACLIGSDDVVSTNVSQPAMEIVASRSQFWPNTLQLMGWDIRDPGLFVVLAPELPGFVGEQIGPDFGEFLKENQIALESIQQFAAHPGGVKVLNALAKSLQVSDSRFKHSRQVLRQHGNMSSPTCLFALKSIVEQEPPQPGEYTAVLAMGPGFSSQYVLLKRT